MNKLTALIAAVLTLSLLSACGADINIPPPEPTENTVESAENSAFKRFTLTLDELSKGIDSSVKALSGEDAEVRSEVGEWEVISEGLLDDNGVEYTSYRNSKRAGILTAAVENDSKKLMNVGCGCEKSLLDDVESRDSYLTLAAVLAENIGGFTEGDAVFLRIMLGELLDGEDELLYYESVMYSKSEYDGTLMIIMAPSDAVFATLRRARMYGEEEKD